jgi:nucleoside-diphosphate-sugar epimerase
VLSAETGLRCLTARAFTVFGAGEHAGRLWPTLRAARGGGLVRLSAGGQSRDFAWADDVAEGLLRLGVSPARPGEVVNLATGVLHTVREFAEQAARVLGIAPEQLVFGAESVRPDEMRVAGVAVDRLRSLTGWMPDANLGDAMRRAVRFEDGLEPGTGAYRDG